MKLIDLQLRHIELEDQKPQLNLFLMKLKGLVQKEKKSYFFTLVQLKG